VIRYRPVGEEGWRKARTQNVSRSGVLFLTDEVLDVTTALEMSLRFELDEHSPKAGEAQLVGAVIRSEELQPGLRAIAATIEEHHLLRADPNSFD
jgi:hypothetical protein